MNDTTPDEMPDARAAGSDQALLDLAHVVRTLRVQCPWDREQTHRTLLNHLIEETAEVVDAVETNPDGLPGDAPDDTALVEELGDLLAQVYFHSAIAEQEGRFTLGEVARGITDKLVRRHPHVFAADDVPDDLDVTWEQQKKREKGRTSSLDGIPHSLDTLARAAKVVSRSRTHGVELGLPDEPVTADEVGRGILALVARARAHGIDPDQATRDALRGLEAQVRARENA